MSVNFLQPLQRLCGLRLAQGEWLRRLTRQGYKFKVEIHRLVNSRDICDTLESRIYKDRRAGIYVEVAG